MPWHLVRLDTDYDTARLIYKIKRRLAIPEGRAAVSGSQLHVPFLVPLKTHPTQTPKKQRFLLRLTVFLVFTFFLFRLPLFLPFHLALP
jgi:hypothetical protein